MSEPRRESPAWAYALEDAIFHGLCFALIGPVIAFLLSGILSSVVAVPRIGLAQATANAAGFGTLLGTIYAFIALVVLGPFMFVSGVVISVFARRIRDERKLAILGFVAIAAMAVVFIPITGTPGHNSRLPLPWDGPLEVFVSGLTGFLLIRVTRFLRKLRDRRATVRCGLPT